MCDTVPARRASNGGILGAVLTTTHAKPLLKIPGLEIIDKLGSGAQADVFLARRGPGLYAIKVYRSVTSAALRREVRVLSCVSHPSIPAIMEVGEVDGRPFIVLERVDGVPLSERIKSGAVPEQQLVEIAIVLAEGLAAVHSHGQLHRDVKPDNIIIEKATGLPKIMDFGLAQGGGTGDEGDTGRFVGSAAYVSPEGAGLIKRVEDGRSDLYSLGIVLFEAATGRRPFASDDVAELLRMHAGVLPPTPRELKPELSLGMSAIILRLLAKDPDARYPSANALATDLRRINEINEALQQTGTTAPIDETGERISVDLPLVARDEERKSLLKAWKGVSENRGSAFLIEGEAGTGKSRLIRELLPLAQRSATLVLTAKASHGNPLPFAVLRDAIDTRLRRVRWMPDDVRESFERQLQEAAGDDATVVATLSPMLARVLRVGTEEQAAPDSLRAIYASFFVRLARACGRVLFVIDDVQWLDEGTVDVLSSVSRRLSDTPLFLAMTSRTEEESEDGYRRFMASMGGHLAAHERLSRLDQRGAAQLISVVLAGSEINPAFVERMYTRCQGNPFMLVEYVHTMLEEGYIRPSWGSWLVDMSAIDQLGISADVSRLLSRRVEGLSAAARDVLQGAALLGARFHPRQLPASADTEVDVVGNALAEAVRASLIEPLLDGGYAFVHDRIRESFLARMDDAKRAELHGAIADLLQQQEDPSPADTVSLGHHLAHADRSRDPVRLLEACRAAADELQRQSAHQEAIVYLSIVEEAAERLGRSLEADHYMKLGVSLERTRQFKRSLAALSTAIELEPAPERRTDITSRMYHVRSASNDVLSWDTVEKEFAATRTPGLWGRKVPLMLITALPWFLLALFSLKTGIGYGTAKGSKRKKLINQTRLYEAASWVAFHTADPLRYVALALREAYGAVRAGACAAAGASLSNVVMLAAQFNMIGLRDYLAAKVEEMWLATGDRELFSHTIWSHTMSLLLTPQGSPVEAARHTEEQIRQHGEWLHAHVWKNLADALQLGYALQGRHDDVLRWDSALAERDSDFRSFAMMALAARGEFAQANEYFDGTRDYVLAQPRHALCVALFASSSMGYFYFARRRDEQAIEEIRDIYRRLDFDPKLTLYPFCFFYLGYGYLLLDQIVNTATEEERALFIERLESTVKDFGQMTRYNLLIPHLEVLTAGLLVIKKRYRQAQKHLDVAERLAKEHGVAWALFETARMRARICTAEGDAQAAAAQVTEAYALAERHDWVTLQRALLEEFGQKANPGDALTRTRTVTDSTLASTRDSGRSFAYTLQQRKLDALMSVSRACASVVDLPQLSQKVVDEATQVMGAERAFLFITNPETDELQLKARTEAKGSSGTHSRTIVNRVWTSGNGVVSTASSEGEVLSSESVEAQGLRSVIAAPLMFQETVRGVIYLDSRLVSGLFTEDDLDILQALATQVAAALETAHMASLQAHRAALERDMALTGAVQSLLLPSETSVQLGAASLAGFSKPADKSGGDWWWFDTTEDGRLLVFVGDATGHGAGPAMVTATFAGLFDVIMGRGGTNRSIDAALRELSVRYARLCGRSYSLAFTMFELQPETGAFRYWPGGLPPSLILRADSSKLDFVQARGTPFTSVPHAELSVVEGRLGRGDRIVMYTDGLSEAEPDKRRPVGTKGMGRMLSKTHGKSIDSARQHFVDSAREIMNDWKSQDDDVTLVFVDKH